MFEPEVETLPWGQREETDDPLFRRQVSYLFECSRFYRAKLTEAGLGNADEIGGLEGIARLPFTEKDELRRSATGTDPVGAHLCAPLSEAVRIFSTSGTTGAPSYIPLTAPDLDNWIRTSSRSYVSAGAGRGDRVITTYGAGPFVVGAALDAFNRIGICHIPVGGGNTERLLSAVRLLEPDVLALTPSYALHLAEVAAERGLEPAASSVKRLLVAGEPGGGEPQMRASLETLWGARVTEVMGIGDISVSLWGECEHQTGMHFCGQGFVHVELVYPVSGEALPMTEGACGELVYTHLAHRAAPLLRFRSRDHVEVRTDSCPCGRTGPRVRCIGRTDDMLIVRGVNVFPSALRQVVGGFAPRVSGVISVRPRAAGVKQPPPLPVAVELAQGEQAEADLADAIRKAVRQSLLVSTEIEFVPFGALPRSDYKSRMVDTSFAST